MESTPDRNGKLFLLFGLAAVLCTCAVLYTYFFMPVPVPPQPVLHTATSPAGASLILHRVERTDNTEVDLRDATYRNPLKKLNIGRGRGSLGVRVGYTGNEKGKPCIMDLHTDGQVLMLLCTVLDQHGDPVSGNLFYKHKTGAHEDGVASWGVHPSGEVDISMASDGDVPGVRLELDDGGGDWIPAVGPFHFREREGTVFYFRAANWTLPSWKLRAHMASGEEIHFTVKNPSPTARKAWTGSPTPLKMTTPDFDLHITRVAWSPAYQYFYIDKKIEMNPGSEQPREAFEILRVHKEDDLGNTSPGWFHPGMQNIKVKGEVRRTDFYRRLAKDCTPITTIIWPDQPTISTPLELDIVDPPPLRHYLDPDRNRFNQYGP